MKAQLIENMNRNLSNLQVLYVKLHNYHWNIKGFRFFQVHNLTEEYYDHIAKLYDDVAERILQIGGKPFSSMSEYLANADIKEESKKDFGEEEVLRNIIADFEQLLSDYNKISDIADEAGDKASVGMADENIAYFEKALWMLKANFA